MSEVAAAVQPESETAVGPDPKLYAQEMAAAEKMAAVEFDFSGAIVLEFEAVVAAEHRIGFLDSVTGVLAVAGQPELAAAVVESQALVLEFYIAHEFVLVSFQYFQQFVGLSAALPLR